VQKCSASQDFCWIRSLKELEGPSGNRRTRTIEDLKKDDVKASFQATEIQDYIKNLFRMKD
jgi:hypothetical protein